MRLTIPARMCALLLALFAWGGLALQVQSSRMDFAGLDMAGHLWRLARFFTILTNLIVAATFTVTALRGRAPGALWGGGVTLWIGMVGMVNYALLSRPLVGVDLWADAVLHAVVPLSAMMWWLGFADRKGLDWSAALVWLAWPASYVVYVLLRGDWDGDYPYFFLNPDRIGWGGVARWSLSLGIGFWLTGLMLVALARGLGSGRAARVES